LTALVQTSVACLSVDDAGTLNDTRGVLGELIAMGSQVGLVMGSCRATCTRMVLGVAIV